MQIDERTLLPGDRLPTELELCSLHGVSRITARRAVQELEKLDLVYRTKGKGTFVKVPGGWDEFCPFRADATRSRLISAVLPHQPGSSFELLRGMEDECKKRGYFISFHNSGDDSAHEREIVRDLVESRHTSGLLVYPVSSSCNIGLYSSFVIRGVPLVFVDREVDGISAPLVKAANVLGGRQAVAHLIALGHRRIGFVAADLRGVRPAWERYMGYCAELVDAKIELDESLVYDCASFARDPGDPGAGGAPSLVEWLKGCSRAPTALLFENDIMAIDFLRAAAHAGVAVPGDLSVVGFDDLPVSSHLPVPLTTIEQPFFQIGALSVRKLITVISGEKVLLAVSEVGTKLVVRASTGAARNESDRWHKSAMSSIIVQ